MPHSPPRGPQIEKLKRRPGLCNALMLNDPGTAAGSPFVTRGLTGLGPARSLWHETILVQVLVRRYHVR
jgi:hypothetical protein